MKSITLSEVSDSLIHKLEERAAANDRTIEAEALSCLRATVEMEDDLIGSIPSEQWADIERSVSETIHDRGTPLTGADFKRYKDLASGHSST